MKTSFLLALLIFTQGAFAQISPKDALNPLPRPTQSPVPTPPPNKAFINKYGLCLDALKEAYVANGMAPPFLVSPVGQITVNVDGMIETYTEYGTVKATKTCSFDSSRKIDAAIELLTQYPELTVLHQKNKGNDKGAKIQIALDACKAHAIIQKSIDRSSDKIKPAQKNSSGVK